MAFGYRPSVAHLLGPHFFDGRGRCSDPMGFPMGFPDRIRVGPPGLTVATELLPGALSGWWQLKDFLFSPRKLGEDSQLGLKPPTSCCFLINLLETFLVPSWCKLVNVFSCFSFEYLDNVYPSFQISSTSRWTYQYSKSSKLFVKKSSKL